MLGISRVLNHVIDFVKDGPTDVKRRPRLLVATHLAKVIKVDQDDVSIDIRRRLTHPPSQRDATENYVFPRTRVFKQNHSISQHCPTDKVSRASRTVLNTGLLYLQGSVIAKR